MPATTFIDPAALSFAPPSPAPSSSYTHDDDEDAGPSRKRQRTADSNDTTKELSVSEQRKEARAHRNRIAAQNSRDRRKAQFTYLERRVAELEEENRRLRAGIQVPPAAPSPAQVPAPGFASQVALSSVLEDRLRAERERERERENQELKERIRTLERGWDAVVKALAAQGLPTGLTQPTPAQNTPSVVVPTQQPTTTIKPPYTAFPSPAPSNASLDFDLSISASNPSTTSRLFAAPPPQTPVAQTTDTHSQTTRHLARVATTGGPSLARSVSLQRVVSAVSVPPYLRALQLKGMAPPLSTATRRWRRSFGRSSRRRGLSMRSPCAERALRK